MVSRRVLGAVAVVGLATGVVLAGPAHTSGADGGAAAEAQQLYRDEVALHAQQVSLQGTLDAMEQQRSRAAATAHLAAPVSPVAPAGAPAPAAPAAKSAGAPVSAPPSAPVGAPVRGDGGGSVSEEGPSTTTTLAPPSTTAPPTTTTTAPPPTTTTTRPRSDD